MSVADKITRLTTARDNIRTALANKGVSATNHGFETFATDIGKIQVGDPHIARGNVVIPEKTHILTFQNLPFTPKAFMIQVIKYQDIHTVMGAGDRCIHTLVTENRKYSSSGYNQLQLGVTYYERNSSGSGTGYKGTIITSDVASIVTYANKSVTIDFTKAGGSLYNEMSFLATGYGYTWIVTDKYFFGEY